MRSIRICILVTLFGCLTTKGIALPLEAHKDFTVTPAISDDDHIGADPLTLLDIESGSQLQSAAGEQLQRSTRNLGLGFGGSSGKFGGLGHGFGSFSGLGIGLGGFHGLGGGFGGLGGGFKPFFHKLG